MIFEVMFWGESGVEVREVEGFQAARELARERARASGRKTIVQRKIQSGWRVLIIDASTGDVLSIESGLTKRQAGLVWRRWRARANQAVCVPLPEWADVRLIKAG